MPHQQTPESSGMANAGGGDSGPGGSPQTDPTNPHHAEATGKWVANEEASPRRADEPGLTDEIREERQPGYQEKT